MKEFEVTIKVRNNLLKQRRLELGMNQADISRAIGINHSLYNALETMKDSPMGPRGWRPAAQRVADFHGLSCEELFPSAIRSVKKATVSRLFTADEAQMLSGGVLSDVQSLSENAQSRDVVMGAVKLLTPEEQSVLFHRFGLAGHEEMTREEMIDANIIGRKVTVVRLQQIEEKALRKLRHPSRSAKLREVA